MDYSLPGFSAHGDSPGKNTGVGCHAFLQLAKLGKGRTDMLLRGYQNLPEEGAVTSGCAPGADCLIWMAWRLRKPSARQGKTSTRESEPTGCSDWANATVGTLLSYPRLQWFYCVYDIC